MIPLVFPLPLFPTAMSNALIVFAWLVFSFLFWRGLRRWGIVEDRIFDLTFYSTLVAFIFARFGYVVTNWPVFAGKSLLLIPALWVSPGLSWFGALVGGSATLVFLSRSYKVRLGWVLDTLPFALPIPVIIGEIASLVSALEVGRVTRFIWGVTYAGHDGLRHPVQLYEIIGVTAVALIMLKLSRIAVRKKLPYGIVGVWFFFLYSFMMFVLEFVKDSHVYWGGLTANQWVLIGVFAECIGVIYVRGGGRETLRPILRSVHSFIQEKGKGIYAAISRRNAR